ncbi:EthD domain-containing protein [Mycobacterium sp.]|uniref:EthD domain-containing protein n=1 Tax=Mycobacterium sp. TaxID=1785 RepID=UPI003D6A5D65
MIKIVFCLRRLPSLSSEEFYRYWLERHAPLVREHAGALRIRRYTQGHAFTDPRLAAAVDARGCQVQPYDGVAEVYWSSVDDLVDAASTDEGRTAGRALLADERKFIDLPNSALFYAHEHGIVSE